MPDLLGPHLSRVGGVESSLPVQALDHGASAGSAVRSTRKSNFPRSIVETSFKTEPAGFCRRHRGADQASWQVMRRRGFTVDREFDHPQVPQGSPLRRHVRHAASHHQHNEQPDTASTWPRPRAASPSFSGKVAWCPYAAREP